MTHRLIATGCLIALLAVAFGGAPRSAMADTTAPESDEQDGDRTGFVFADRLTVRPIFEYEWFNDQLRTRNGLHDRESGVEGSFDLGFELQLSDHVDAQLGFTYDLDDAHGYLDEYTIGWSGDRTSITAGLQTLPFAETDSFFISDPLTRFTELDSESVVLAWELAESWYVEAGVYKGPSETESDRSDDVDATALIEWQISDEIALGLGIMSDLTDGSDVLDPEEPAVRDKRTPAYGVTATWTGDNFAASADISAARRAIPGVENDINRPRAWAVQGAWFARPDLDIALRVEGSRELADAPRRNYGVAVTWRVHPNATLAFELMRGKYARDFVFDDDDNEFATNRRGAVQLTVRF